jgi:hypothetical protein
MAEIRWQPDVWYLNLPRADAAPLFAPHNFLARIDLAVDQNPASACEPCQNVPVLRLH